MKRICISNATLVNEGKVYRGSLMIEGDKIVQIVQPDEPKPACEEEIDATGCYLLPGVIDDHVHFREPGLTQKADMASESRAAAAGGVTSYFEMPNTTPQTTTLEALEEKRKLAAQKSLVNYSFFFGATNSNVHLLPLLDRQHTCGVKLFMGSSTGNMLVDKAEALKTIFRTSTLPIMTHCEDSAIISRNMAHYKKAYGDDPVICFHPHIRSAEACYRSTALAVRLAQETGAQLHVAHVSTAKELDLIPANNPKITAEACMAHLLFCQADYNTLGARIKCNPAIKTEADQNALRAALTNGKIRVIGTDHAPHLLAEKQGGSSKAVSGMPMVQFSLVAGLQLVDQGILTLEQLVSLMCHNPASLFQIDKRGFLRVGYKADLVLVRPGTTWQLKPACIESKCQWSPLEGQTFNWRVESTFCNGHLVYNQPQGVIDNTRGEEICFNR